MNEELRMSLKGEETNFFTSKKFYSDFQLNEKKNQLVKQSILLSLQILTLISSETTLT